MRPVHSILTMLLISWSLATIRAQAAPLSFPEIGSLELESRILERRILADFDHGPNLTPEERHFYKTQYAELKQKVALAVGQACASGCTFDDFSDAAALGLVHFIEASIQGRPGGLSLTNDPAGRPSNLYNFYIKARAFLVYTGLIWGSGYVTGFIPDSAGATKLIVAGVVGGVIANAGAFFGDSLNFRVRGLFFRMASTIQTTAASLGLPTYSRFRSIWQTGQDLMGDSGVSEGRNRENMVQQAIQKILTEVTKVNQRPRERAELLAYAMRRYRTTFPEVSAVTSEGPSGTGSIDEGFAIVLRAYFSDPEAVFTLLTIAKFQDKEYADVAKKALEAEAAGDSATVRRLEARKTDIMDYYKKLTLLWLKPEQWDNPTLGSALIGAYERKAPELDRQYLEKAREVEQILAAQAGACNSLNTEIELIYVVKSSEPNP